jgi:hypothetical protein
VESVEIVHPCGFSFILDFVVSLGFYLEGESQSLLSKVQFLLVWSFDGLNDLHDTSFFVGCWPQRVCDDDGVWFLVEGHEVDLVEFITFKMGWGDGNFNLSTWGKTDQGTEWEFGDDMTLETSLVFLSDEWNLEAQFLMCFPSIDWVEFSLDLEVLVVLRDELDESSEGDMDWHTEVVRAWESKDGWDFHKVFTEVEGLLEMDWVSSSEFG